VVVRALVIDDSRAMRALLTRALGQAGFEVSAACNGREGLERLRAEGRFDIVLVDWHMPEMDGYEFVRSVRALPEFREQRVMMVTSETELGQVARALEAGADEYMMKPFTNEALLGKLELLGVGGQ
jgi:two-component system chemotaxis response regulator CheY